MARYWRQQKNLVINGIVPGSTVGVWTTDNGDIDQKLFIERVHDEEVKVSVPREHNILVRVRNVEFTPFETTIDTFGVDESTPIQLSVIAVRDM